MYLPKLWSKLFAHTDIQYVQGFANPGTTIHALAARMAGYGIAQRESVFNTSYRDIMQPVRRRDLAPLRYVARGSSFWNVQLYDRIGDGSLG